MRQDADSGSVATSQEISDNSESSKASSRKALCRKRPAAMPIPSEPTPKRRQLTPIFYTPPVVTSAFTNSEGGAEASGCTARMTTPIPVQVEAGGAPSTSGLVFPFAATVRTLTPGRVLPSLLGRPSEDTSGNDTTSAETQTVTIHVSTVAPYERFVIRDPQRLEETPDDLIYYNNHLTMTVEEILETYTPKIMALAPDCDRINLIDVLKQAHLGARWESDFTRTNVRPFLPPVVQPDEVVPKTAKGKDQRGRPSSAPPTNFRRMATRSQSPTSSDQEITTEIELKRIREGSGVVKNFFQKNPPRQKCLQRTRCRTAFDVNKDSRLTVKKNVPPRLVPHGRPDSERGQVIATLNQAYLALGSWIHYAPAGIPCVGFDEISGRPILVSNFAGDGHDGRPGERVQSASRHQATWERQRAVAHAGIQRLGATTGSLRNSDALIVEIQSAIEDCEEAYQLYLNEQGRLQNT